MVRLQQKPGIQYNRYKWPVGDELLVNKKHKELLQSYDVRSSAAEDFVRSVRPGLQVSSGPLLDPKVRTLAVLL